MVPAHESHGAIDLFAAETGFALAETLALLGDQLDGEVRSEVRAQIERRMLAPYLRLHQNHWWYRGHNNWNGVCNSAVAATFLLIEPEPARAAEAGLSRQVVLSAGSRPRSSQRFITRTTMTQ